MQSDVSKIKSDGAFVTLSGAVQIELVLFCKVHGICPEWMSNGLAHKIELNQYEELRMLVRGNGESDLPGFAVFESVSEAVVGADDDTVVAAGYADDAPGDVIEYQPPSRHTRHKNN